MKQSVNKNYKPLFTEDYRYAILMGGRAGARSHSASQFALANLLSDNYFRCAIMRYVSRDVRKSIFQDILDRAEEQGVIDKLNIKTNTMEIEYGSNKIKGMGFKKQSSGQTAKLKSIANYNCAIIEEGDEVAEEDFMQLDDSIRTEKGKVKIIMMLNPPKKDHWVIERWFDLKQPNEVPEGYYLPILKEDIDDTLYIRTTYEDNITNLNEKTVQNYERYKKTNPQHYYNMIRGYVTEGQRGRIFDDWEQISNKEFEDLPYNSIYGLDFGFTNDPTALLEIKIHNEKIWCRELIYETGLTNQMIAQRINDYDIDGRIYADSAEPKSIAEIRKHGINITGADKGKDSIRAGIDFLKSKKIHITSDSENLKKENREYRWALDINKNPKNKPKDEMNHLIDALRYGVYTHLNKPFVGFV